MPFLYQKLLPLPECDEPEELECPPEYEECPPELPPEEDEPRSRGLYILETVLWVNTSAIFCTASVPGTRWSFASYAVLTVFMLLFAEETEIDEVISETIPARTPLPAQTRGARGVRPVFSVESR